MTVKNICSRGGGFLNTARMSLNAAAIRSGRLRVVCAADGARGREVTDEMTVTVECEFNQICNANTVFIDNYNL